MLPLSSKILFFVYALVFGALGLWGFYRLYLRIHRGAAAAEPRADVLGRRLIDAAISSLTQERTFRRRSAISTFHAFIFYGFVYYLLVNLVDALEGYLPFAITSASPLGAVYNLLADVLSFLVLLGVVALVIRRLFLPSKRDFRFNGKSLLHPWVKNNYILRDSLIVSAFIVFHVGSRVLGQGAKVALEGGDSFQPFSTLIGHTLFGGLSASALEGWRVFGYWGALGSVLAFLAYFPYTKHIHIFMAPLNYTFKRPVNSGTLPPMKGLDAMMEQEDPKLGAEKLEDLEWPRLLDAYACIQCNRCQDVCPANATGKALSPAALEINKRMALNEIAAHPSPFTLKTAAFEQGGMTELPLLEFAISEEAVWACTTCGACMQVCPVQDEQMLDIIDIRRQQVMVAGEFPPQLQSAFRGMERAQNPWGLSRDKRFEWADGLKVPTIDENPEPDVLYWVGCAASYDPGAQKVARSFVQLLDKAGVNYAVLGKKEACTGDSARRAGNEFLYQTLAEQNIATLNEVRPKLIVATCPHCMNMIGNEYPQLGGHYQTMHHTTYLETLVAGGQLQMAPLSAAVTYHDPCYLGRHNGVYDAPRHVIQSMGLEILELERTRENSFCCGAGGAQFWKEEEDGNERISDNRFKEIQARLDSAKEGKVLAVGCPFCKSMLNSTPSKQGQEDVVVRDVAELMLESVQRASGEWQEAAAVSAPVSVPNAELPIGAGETPRPDDSNADAPAAVVGETTSEVINDQPEEAASAAPAPAPARPKWNRKDDVSAVPPQPGTPETPAEAAPVRKKWNQKDDVRQDTVVEAPETPVVSPDAPPARKKWGKGSAAPQNEAAETVAEAAAPVAVEPEQTEPTAPQGERPKWKPGGVKATPTASTEPTSAPAPEPQPSATPSERPKWKPGAPKADAAPAVPASAEPPAATEPGERPKWQPETGRKKWTPKK
ncbi:[Fe-S]-binding protein [Deinococcus irradiatisoli]|uniref:[Fe-S]-binding protein n=1 Tax=Deinococcus irradiatisoli TaxID=2202254 RepID=A0A2Z3JCZ9_9DEIO|nr:heterodisulfide reductase-related iron-sulfur binding cluster [Deinococcus irradiatisoli]AWN23053.1 [Fe-S]-binding protein [Deinococcus irradiatisoli]